MNYKCQCPKPDIIVTEHTFWATWWQDTKNTDLHFKKATMFCERCGTPICEECGVKVYVLPCTICGNFDNVATVRVGYTETVCPTCAEGLR